MFCESRRLIKIIFNHETEIVCDFNTEPFIQDGHLPILTIPFSGSMAHTRFLQCLLMFWGARGKNADINVMLSIIML